MRAGRLRIDDRRGAAIVLILKSADGRIASCACVDVIRRAHGRIALRSTTAWHRRVAGDK